MKNHKTDHLQILKSLVSQ